MSSSTTIEWWLSYHLVPSFAITPHGLTVRKVMTHELDLVAHDLQSEDWMKMTWIWSLLSQEMEDSIEKKLKFTEYFESRLFGWRYQNISCIQILFHQESFTEFSHPTMIQPLNHHPLSHNQAANPRPFQNSEDPGHFCFGALTWGEVAADQFLNRMSIHG